MDEENHADQDEDGRIGRQQYAQGSGVHVRRSGVEQQSLPAVFWLLTGGTSDTASWVHPPKCHAATVTPRHCRTSVTTAEIDA
ncbi:hypothetical protein GCM10010313_19060 [Streptomyces violarus]|nr:hypothetical protein GCM10010313_19060 [Streptomyces violarus]